MGCIQCDREALIIRWLRPTRGSGTMGGGGKFLKIYMKGKEVNSLPKITKDITMGLFLKA